MTAAAPGSLKRNQSVARASGLLRAVAARPRGATAAELPPDAELSEPLARFTPRTITEPSALRRELDAVRARGYAELVDELEDGLAAVAVPVRDERGGLLAALALSGPSGRFDDLARS